MGVQINVHQRSNARHITRLISINLCCTKLKISTKHLEILARYHFLWTGKKGCGVTLFQDAIQTENESK